MGRGLSELQRTILRLALVARRKPPPDQSWLPPKLREQLPPPSPEPLRLAEVLIRHWGWQPIPGRTSYDGAPKFDPEQIGRRRYNAARASLARAVRRLRERNLIRRSAAGIHLTDAGLPVAERLMGAYASAAEEDPTA